MTTTDTPMSLKALRQWLNANRERVQQEARQGDTLAVALFAADIVYSNFKRRYAPEATEAALRKAVKDYMEAKGK